MKKAGKIHISKIGIFLACIPLIFALLFLIMSIGDNRSSSLGVIFLSPITWIFVFIVISIPFYILGFITEIIFKSKLNLPNWTKGLILAIFIWILPTVYSQNIISLITAVLIGAFIGLLFDIFYKKKPKKKLK